MARRDWRGRILLGFEGRNVIAQIRYNRLDKPSVDGVQMLDRSCEQYAAQQRVKATGHAAAGVCQHVERILGEMRIAGPTDDPQAMLDIGADFLELHGRQMMRRDDPLAQLLEPLRAGDALAEFGLAEQEDLQQRLPAELEIAQHPQLFQCIAAHILGFIDDEQGAPPFPCLMMEESLHPTENLRLLCIVGLDTECLRSQSQHIIAAHLRGDDLGRDEPLRIDGYHQVADERRLARANIARDDNEALALRQTIAKL